MLSFDTLARACAIALTFGALAEPVPAQTVPGPVDEAIIGDWQCGDTRVYITLLGSIELIDGDYTAGLMRAEDGSMEIEWDLDSTRSDWAYDVTEDDLTLMPQEDPDLYCVPRG